MTDMRLPDEFAHLVKEYCMMHDDITTTQKTLTALKKKKADTMTKVVNIMESHDITAFDVGDGFLRKFTTAKKAPVNKVVMLNTLIETFGPDKAEETMQKIYGDRPTTETTGLRRTFDKKRKNDDV